MSYYWGLDLGQSADYSALAIIEEPVWIIEAGQWGFPSQLAVENLDFHAKRAGEKGRPANTPPEVRHL